MKMEKAENVSQSQNCPRPVWKLAAIESVFPPYCQFIVHQCSRYTDANAGRVVDVNVSTPEMHAAFVLQVLSEIDTNDLRNLLKYNSIWYSSESRNMVHNPKQFPVFLKDWNF